MVMANNELDVPSAQHVGREFVRQYYTLLNEAPYHLHRFYSHNSCFVHGGVEKPGEELPPVMGQSEIHKKILSLNFRDCHAKIRQVDSQATVGQGVVVQVTGELSNNGEPMRRFMQTFVLAPQSPKKYYVHNDVFRYQDEVFQEEEEPEEEEIEQPITEVVENGGQADESAQEAMFYDQQAALRYTSHDNGTAHEDEVDIPSPSPTMEKPKVPEPEVIENEVESQDIEEEASFEKPETKPVLEAEPEPQAEPKAFSWAALASKNTGTIGAPREPAFGTPTQTKAQMSRPEPKPDIGPASVTTAQPSLVSGTLGATQPQPQRAPKLPKENRFQDRDRSSMSRGEDGDGDSISGRRVGPKYPDSHQLFVGNLPHNITERELKAFFEGYGKVMELRINTKSSGGRLPNFGFVVFESVDTVQDILSQLPIKYNGEHRLNVEEKKPRGGDGRPSSGRGAPRGGGPGGMNRGSGQYSGGNVRGGMKSGGFGDRRDGERRGGMGGSGAGNGHQRSGQNQSTPRR